LPQLRSESLNPDWSYFVCHPCHHQPVLTGILCGINCCQICLSQPELHLELGSLPVEGAVSEDLCKESLVVSGNDGLVEGVEVGGIAPEAGTEPGWEGLERLFIKVRLGIEFHNASIMLACCQGCKACNSSIVQLLDKASKLLPVMCRYGEVGELSPIVLKSWGTFERLSSNGIELALELKSLAICLVEGLLDTVLPVLVGLVPLL
jgi:hypothetical protein